MANSSETCGMDRVVWVPRSPTQMRSLSRGGFTIVFSHLNHLPRLFLRLSSSASRRRGRKESPLLSTPVCLSGSTQLRSCRLENSASKSGPPGDDITVASRIKIPFSSLLRVFLPSSSTGSIIRLPSDLTSEYLSCRNASFSTQWEMSGLNGRRFLWHLKSCGRLFT